MNKNYTTTVVDVGARYGMHPSWNDFGGELNYIAFEPDCEEADRLRKSNDPDTFKVIEEAVFNKSGSFDFNLLVHRGMSSFLKPDLDSEAFSDLKPGLGEIEKIIKIKTEPLDYFTQKNQWIVDFIKVDTEGTEHEVTESAENTINSGVLGIRSSINFNPAFHNQILFSTTHDYLLKKGFMLLNIDYFGYGYPKLGLFKKPDPNIPERNRYGVLVGCDAVWIKKPQNLIQLNRCSTREGFESSVLKLAYFCYLNDAPDVAVDILLKNTLNYGPFNLHETISSKLYKSLKVSIYKYLGQWRTVPDETWAAAQRYYNEIYNETLHGGSEYYPNLQKMLKNI